MFDVFLDALLDGLKILPFILLIYILMELMENARKKESIERVLSGPFAPVVASALGAVPECGFAAMCAKLYDKGLIRTGTLIAAFVSISDEGVIILVTAGKFTQAIAITLVKIVYAIIVGELLNVLFFRRERDHVCPEKDNCIECGEKHENKWDKYLLHPFIHALKIFIYLFAINFILGTAIYLIGEENISAFMNESLYIQPLMAGLIGLIPNCGSSIIIAQAYIGGIVGFSGLIAGLSANAGIGILILFRNRRNFKKCIMIVAIQFAAAVILGYLTFAVLAIFA